MRIRRTLSNHSSQIFLAAGIGGFVAAIVTAVMKADKVKPIIEETKDDFKAATFDDYRFGFKTKGDEYRFKAYVVARGVAKASKELVIPISLATASTGCILKSFKIVNNNKLALMGSVKAMDSYIKTYKNVVKEEVGEDVVEKIENKMVTKKIIDQLTDVRKGDGHSCDDNEIFYKYFSKETSNKFPEGGADTVLPFLKGKETYFNQLLHSRTSHGHPGVVRFNEVLDELGFPKIPEGEIAGWISYGDEGFVDFGISGAYYADYDGVLDRYNCVRAVDKIPRSDSGYMLCFNVDPCIIKRRF